LSHYLKDVPDFQFLPVNDALIALSHQTLWPTRRDTNSYAQPCRGATC